MNATVQMELKKGIEEWVRVKGIRQVMRLTAVHLLPKTKFNFILNVGGGSHTNGKEVVVGIPELTFPMDKEIVFSVTKALVGHETEHVMSSDFTVFKQFQQDVKVYFKDHYNLKLGARLGAHMLNSTEDGRIEKRLINRYPGYKKNIQLLNGIFWDGQPVKGTDEMMEFLYSITSICVTGLKSKDWEKYYGGTEADELLDEIRPLIIKAINNPTAKGCAEDTMKIVEIIAPYMAVKLEDLKNRQKLEKAISEDADYHTSNPQEGAESQPGGFDSSHFLEEEDEDKKKGKGQGDEEGEGEGEESDEESEDESKEKSDEGETDESNDESEPKEGEDGESGDDGEESNEDEESDDESDKKSDDDSETEDENSDDQPSEEKPEMSPEEVEKMIQDMLDNLKDEVAEEAEREMLQGEREVAKEEARNQAENKYTGHLTEAEILAVDKNKNFRQVDPVNFRNKPLSDEIKKQGKFANKQLQKIFLNKKSFNSSNRRSGQVDTSGLWKLGVEDYNVFKKTGNPNLSDYAVNVLVDASGSMMGAGDNKGNTKLQLAYESTAMIEEALRGLVSTRITFFTEMGSTVVHSTVRDFDQVSKDTLSWKRIPALQNAGNRDGYSIAIATQELLKRKEKKKILIVLSDGAPWDQGEVTSAVREARKKGIVVIGIAFGSESEMKRNKKVYEAMYQKGIIMVQPDKISRELTRVIEKEVSK